LRQLFRATARMPDGFARPQPPPAPRYRAEHPRGARALCTSDVLRPRSGSTPKYAYTCVRNRARRRAASMELASRAHVQRARERARAPKRARRRPAAPRGALVAVRNGGGVPLDHQEHAQAKKAFARHRGVRDHSASPHLLHALGVRVLHGGLLSSSTQPITIPPVLAADRPLGRLMLLTRSGGDVGPKQRGG
jgi:hypothetical protein